MVKTDLISVGIEQHQNGWLVFSGHPVQDYGRARNYGYVCTSWDEVQSAVRRLTEERLEDVRRESGAASAPHEWSADAKTGSMSLPPAVNISKPAVPGGWGDLTPRQRDVMEQVRLSSGETK